MDLINADVKSLKSLEDLQWHLGVSLISLNTMIELQIKSIKLGIMPDDMNVRAANIIQELQVAVKMLHEQVLENKDLLPPGFDIKEVYKKIKKDEIEKARSFLKKAKAKE